MGRKNSPSAKKELVTLITNYEEAKAENRQLYLDADQLADIADWYASERKFEEAQEVITYGLKIHPGNTDLLIEQAYLYLDTQKLQKAKKVADSITEEFDSLLDEIKGPMQEKGILFGYDEDAARLIAKKSFGDRSGGRAIRRTIRREVEDRIAELLVERAGDPPAMLKVTAEGDEIRLTYA